MPLTPAAQKSSPAIIRRRGKMQSSWLHNPNQTRYSSRSACGDSQSDTCFLGQEGLGCFRRTFKTLSTKLLICGVDGFSAHVHTLVGLLLDAFVSEMCRKAKWQDRTCFIANIVHLIEFLDVWCSLLDTYVTQRDRKVLGREKKNLIQIYCVFCVTFQK